MHNFDYAIAVGICTLAMLIGLRGAIPWMRSTVRRRTDKMLLRIAESNEDQTGNKASTSTVVTKDDKDVNGENKSKATGDYPHSRP